MIRKIILTVTILCSLLIPAAVAMPAFAVDPLNPGGTEGPCNNTAATSRPEVCNDNQSGSNTNPIFGPSGILTVAIRLLSLVVGVGAVIIIVVSGLRMILAGDDANTAATARRSVLYSCAALVVALMAQAIVTFVLNKL